LPISTRPVSLRAWERHYNHERFSMALHRRTPAERLPLSCPLLPANAFVHCRRTNRRTGANLDETQQRDWDAARVKTRGGGSDLIA
jgi:hypothetical protein